MLVRSSSSYLSQKLSFRRPKITTLQPIPRVQYDLLQVDLGRVRLPPEPTVVQAATIGSHVHIGQNAVIGEFAIIKDYVRVLDGAIVAPQHGHPELQHRRRPARARRRRGPRGRPRGLRA
ncbi:hypothetical protein O1611_g3809 [Lasiodiplodia mahajangana]|uniref:Uncharacterized protein n=1 Tax=Lasiodiplodia mahajangana TaxID=1108764 RepID=A0ACC2JRD5_9PEZI|nr:hypothetical protein O1611_g3809 [Lasiodiplodia mahajangana]